MANSQAEIYTIFCLVLGEDTAFPIKIAKDETVGILKEMIKGKKRAFSQQDADSLKLYRVEIAAGVDMEKKADEHMLEGPPELGAMEELMDLFDDGPKRKTLHIIVQRPDNILLETPTQPRKRKLSSPSPDVAHKRQKLFEDRPVAPSSLGNPGTYKRLDPAAYALNRPPSPETIPLALLHNIFGQFTENVRTCEPTVTDNALVRDLREVMSVVHATENDLCHEFREAVGTHYEEISLTAANIGHFPFQSDGHFCLSGYLCVLCEGKLLGKTSGDAEVQVCGYVIASVRQLNPQTTPDLFPCIAVYFYGPLIGFAGIAVTDRVHLEALTPVYPLHTNLHEDEISSQVTRAFCAFRVAFNQLQDHYRKLKDTKGKQTYTPQAMDRLIFPYMEHYVGEDGKRVQFQYRTKLQSNRLIFTAKTRQGINLFIKFTRKYCQEAHRQCALDGIAPQLYAVESLPGGWLMVVMEYLDDKYECLASPSTIRPLLRQEIHRVVEVLHRGGFVHGDIRNVNLMARRQWSEIEGAQNILLVDFDWAGRDGVARYPPNVNNVSVTRPDGVVDGALITRGHDQAMVGYMLGGTTAEHEPSTQ